jgi:hypothetical protein
MAERYFNRREAEELLPMIEPQMKEARRQKQQIDALKEELNKAASRIMLMGGSSPPYAELARRKTESDEALRQLQETINKIQESGCVVKDLDLGLVDFPCLLKGEEVYLCWKLGEEHIGFWHGIEEGFSRRKPLQDSGPEEPPSRPPRIN